MSVETQSELKVENRNLKSEGKSKIETRPAKARQGRHVGSARDPPNVSRPARAAMSVETAAHRGRMNLKVTRNTLNPIEK